MDISGVLVLATPDKRTAVQSRLCELNGVEVHACTDDGRLVVTIENDSATTMDTINAFNDIAGVLSASLIYHQLDEEFATQEKLT
jgi:nitrate reductase NapD